jgi:hypothetical protein
MIVFDVDGGRLEDAQINDPASGLTASKSPSGGRARGARLRGAGVMAA